MTDLPLAEHDLAVQLPRVGPLLGMHFSSTPVTDFDPTLVRRLSTLLGGLPVIGTGAGHDAGILANDGIRTAMLFVRNPTGVSHSPDEWASADDCLAGITALADVVSDLAGES